MSDIHRTADIDPAAKLGEGCSIGAFCVIGPEVTLGNDCQLGPHVVIHGKVTVGDRNNFVSNAAVGGPPQDLKYKGEMTEITIGADNLFREFVTVNRGTVGGGGVTKIGNRNMFMAYSHIAHDCAVGDYTVFANGGTLAGHVHVGSHATVGAFTAVHQFCRVGEYAFIGGFSVLTKDALPFVKTVGARGDAQIYGINSIGLERKGFSTSSIEALKSAYRTLFQSRLLIEDALTCVQQEMGHIPEVAYLIQFIRESKRGIQR